MKYQILKQYNYAGDWYKMKPTKTIDCFIIDRKPGKGKFSNTMGSLELGVYNKQGNVLNIGSVGTGFDDFTRETLWTTLFLNQICIEVEYDSVTKYNKLKFPRFKQFREDKTPQQCLSEQLYAKH